MSGKKRQTYAKQDRERAVKERRERKRVKKAEAAAQRASGGDVPAGHHGSASSPHVETQEKGPQG